MKKISILICAAVLVLAGLALSGCSIRDVTSSMKSFFNKEASAQEETAPVSVENEIFPVQVNNAAGEVFTDANGEPVTVLAVYETATGGEDRVNEQGILETYPLGQIMTYRQGEMVTDEAGNPETYAGGEAVTDVFGAAVKDEEKNNVTRSAGEIVTHGDSDIVYDSEGKPVRSAGEPLTYAAGEYMYDTDGNQVFTGITILKDENGVAARSEDGNPRISAIEIVTDEHGNPFLEEDGELATKVFEPLLPDRVVEEPFEEGIYYVRNIASPYVFFSAPLVPEANITVPEGAQLKTSDTEQTTQQDQTEPAETDASEQETSEEDISEQEISEEDLSSDDGMINNLQLEILGENLPYFDLHFDLEGYAYFVLEGTEQVLGFEGSPANGANIFMQDMEKVFYPQYAYWDDPMFTLENHQKWIIKKLSADVYEICSAADPEYCMTIDDRSGIHYANVMLWKFEDKDQQKFAFQNQTPRIENTIKEDTYFIRSGVSDWMMMSIGDYNFDDARNIYLYHADGLNGQMFNITFDEYGFATITHDESTKVLSIENSQAVNNHYVFQYEADGDDWQKWILDPIPDDDEEDGDEGFVIRSALNVSEVLNVMDGAANELQPIKMYWNDNTPAQKWYFTKEVPTPPVTYESLLAYAQKFYSDTEYLIMVDTIANHVGIYTGYKGNWECVKYWDCVTGKASTPTLKGQYTILGRIPSFDGDTDSPELYTCYYATMFYPEYYFHSIVYYAGTMDVMDATMGWNASHGCIRLYIENAQWIYENIPDGTKVVSF